MTPIIVFLFLAGFVSAAAFVHRIVTATGPVFAVATGFIAITTLLCAVVLSLASIFLP